MNTVSGYEWFNFVESTTVKFTERERHHLLSLLRSWRAVGGSRGDPECAICRTIATKLAKVGDPA